MVKAIIRLVFDDHSGININVFLRHNGHSVSVMNQRLLLYFHFDLIA